MFSQKITKRKFKQLLFDRFRGRFDKPHVWAIVNILFDEMRADLYERNRKIKIKNFCDIVLVKTAPRKYYSFQNDRVQESSGNNLVKVNFFKPVKDIINANIDLDSIKE